MRRSFDLTQVTLTSIYSHFVSSLEHEKTAASSDGFCTPVVGFNKGVEFAFLSRQLQQDHLD